MFVLIFLPRRAVYCSIEFERLRTFAVQSLLEELRTVSANPSPPHPIVERNLLVITEFGVIASYSVDRFPGAIPCIMHE